MTRRWGFRRATGPSALSMRRIGPKVIALATLLVTFGVQAPAGATYLPQGCYGSGEGPFSNERSYSVAHTTCGRANGVQATWVPYYGNGGSFSTGTTPRRFVNTEVWAITNWNLDAGPYAGSNATVEVGYTLGAVDTNSRSCFFYANYNSDGLHLGCGVNLGQNPQGPNRFHIEYLGRYNSGNGLWDHWQSYVDVTPIGPTSFGQGDFVVRGDVGSESYRQGIVNGQETGNGSPQIHWIGLQYSPSRFNLDTQISWTNWGNYSYCKVNYNERQWWFSGTFATDFFDQVGLLDAPPPTCDGAYDSTFRTAWA